MPIISLSISKENHDWLKVFNIRVEQKAGLKVGISKIADTILLHARSNEASLQQYVVARRVDEVRRAVMRRLSKECKKG